MKLGSPVMRNVRQSQKRNSLARILKAMGAWPLGVGKRLLGVPMRDVFAAIEGQLELLRSGLVALIELGKPLPAEELRDAIEQLDGIILKLRRYREG